MQRILGRTLTYLWIWSWPEHSRPCLWFVPQASQVVHDRGVWVSWCVSSAGGQENGSRKELCALTNATLEYRLTPAKHIECRYTVLSWGRAGGGKRLVGGGGISLSQVNHSQPQGWGGGRREVHACTHACAIMQAYVCLAISFSVHLALTYKMSVSLPISVSVS